MSKTILPSEAARALGRIKTEKKAEASRRNGRLSSPGPGVPPVPLSEMPCEIKAGKQAGSPCPGGDSLTGHHWSCPRGQAIIRRQAQGRDVVTGRKLGA